MSVQIYSNLNLDQVSLSFVDVKSDRAYHVEYEAGVAQGFYDEEKYNKFVKG